MENATSFGLQAKDYRASRPTYPDELFQWIASQSVQHQLAWDVGTGSGQAALKLCGCFERVHASDIDENQIVQASKHSQISYVVEPSHASCLPSGSVDAITVATALHWFDPARFWEEVRRVARKDAVFCAWTYHRAETEPDVQHALIDPLTNILEPYWSDGNRLSWRGYTQKEIKMPFDVISAPDFSCNLLWAPSQISAFVRSWSAYQKAQLDGHADSLAQIEQEALAKLGDDFRCFKLPLHVIAARIR